MKQVSHRPSHGGAGELSDGPHEHSMGQTHEDGEAVATAAKLMGKIADEDGCWGSVRRGKDCVVTSRVTHDKYPSITPLQSYHSSSLHSSHHAVLVAAPQQDHRLEVLDIQSPKYPATSTHGREDQQLSTNERCATKVGVEQGR